TISTPAIPTDPTDVATSSTTAKSTSTSSSAPSTTTTVTEPQQTTATTTTTTTTTTVIPPAALVTDPNNPNNLHTSLPTQQPIIDAYLEAIHAETLTYSEWPLDPRSARLVSAPITAKMLDRENSGMVERTKLNQVLDITGGITFRPYVVENGDPNKAFVWDCQIDATFWKDHETGAKAPPDAWPNVGPPGVETGVVAVMILVDGKWMLDDGAPEPQACE
ncbi:MAG: hypothetical protein ABI862_19030, partial [Ilumatobacteraceae bacterium]